MCVCCCLGAQIGNQDSLETVATLLSLDSYHLADALTKKFMVLRGEEITTPLTKEQVRPKHYMQCDEPGSQYDAI